MISSGTLDHIASDIREAIQETVITPAMVNRGYYWFEQLKVESPILYRLIIAIIYQEPERVLGALGMWNGEFSKLRKSPLAIEYVRRLQERLRGGEL